MILSSRKLRTFPIIEPEKLNDAVVISHRNADVDAFCSCYAVAKLVKKINPKSQVNIIIPKGLDALAKKIQKEFNLEINKTIDFLNTDLVIIVDTGDLSLLGEWKEKVESTKSLKIFIDHHPLSPSIKSLTGILLIDENASSSSEIIYRLFKAKKIEIDQETAKAILLGILADSRHLTLANCNTIKTVSELCRKRISLHSLREQLKTPRRKSEIIARMKAAQRLEIYIAQDWIINVTKVNAFQASVANSLIDLGASIALALGDYEGGCKCSLRSTESFYLRTKMHLGKDVAQKIASECNGNGGGHSTAASFYTKYTIDDTLPLVLDVISKNLDIKIKKHHKN